MSHIWIAENRATQMIVKDTNKPQTEIPTKYNTSTMTSTTSSLCSSSTSILSKQSIKTFKSSLKEYGECYKKVGQGTSAVVMIIRNNSTKKLYAIKQFRKKQKTESEKDYMKKLTSEFCISSTFDHPNVVETIDLVLDDKKRYCTVMEYCSGGDLFSCIMKQKLSKTEKYSYFKQLLMGIEYLHSVGVVHRDIKPENLLLMDGRLKISDFGVSDVYRFPWESGQGRQSKGLVGSEPYIAPETFAQKEYWGHSADMWSVGIVFYCLLMGGLAWHKAKRTDATYTSYLLSISNHQVFELFKPLSESELDIILLLLDPNPTSRITAKHLLEHTWIQAIQI